MPVRRGFRRYLAAAVIPFLFGGIAAITALTLLNQIYGWYPVNTFVTGFDFNGISVSPETFAWSMFTVSVVSLLIGLALCLFALRNLKFNQKLAVGKQ